MDRDVVANFPGRWMDAGLLRSTEIGILKEKARAGVTEAAGLLTLKTSPETVRPELWPDPASVDEPILIVRGANVTLPGILKELLPFLADYYPEACNKPVNYGFLPAHYYEFFP